MQKCFFTDCENHDNKEREAAAELAAIFAKAGDK